MDFVVPGSAFVTMPAVRRFFRIAFNTLTVLSLVLAVGVAGLWVRSYWRRDDAWVQISAWNVVLVSSNGQIEVLISQYQSSEKVGWRVQDATKEAPLTSSFQSTFFGFGGRFFTLRTTNNVKMFVPAPALLIGLSCMPLAWMFRNRSRRPKRGVCRSCGYDLRATPDRCPECGAMLKGATV